MFKNVNDLSLPIRGPDSIPCVVIEKKIDSSMKKMIAALKI